MSRPLTKKEAQEFRARWQRVNEREVEELRHTPIEVRWQQFNTLLSWAREFGWIEALGKEEDMVRKRWARLRKESRG
jgi:hypothetical protein